MGMRIGAGEGSILVLDGVGSEVQEPEPVVNCGVRYICY